MTTSLPLVSVIIPTYNRRRYICNALDSVLNQTMRDIEVIVIDDGSTDSSGDMIREKYRDAVIYHYQQNQGRSSARNVGMQLARGKYIAFLDSDDIWKQEKLERQIRPLEESECIGFVQTFSEVMNSDGSANLSETSKRMRLYQKALKRGYSYVGMSQQCIMFLSTVAFRRSLLEAIGPMDPLIPAYEDWDWYLRAALVTEIATIPESLVFYRMHHENTGMDEFIEGRIRTSLKHLGLLESLSSAQVRETAKLNLYMQLVSTYYQKGDFDELGKWMQMALNTNTRAVLKNENWRYFLAMYFPRFTMAARSKLSKRFMEGKK